MLKNIVETKLGKEFALVARVTIQKEIDEKKCRHLSDLSGSIVKGCGIIEKIVGNYLETNKLEENCRQ